MNMPTPRPQRGFTLIEAVIVIAITAVIGGIVALFIRLPVQGYVDSAARADMADTADTSLRRMAREIRLALPNSVRISTVGGAVYLELLLTKAGGRYVSADDDTGAVSFLPLRFATAGDCGATPALCRFQVAGAMPAGRQAILPNDYIVVYNLGEGLAPANAYANVADCSGSGGCNIARVSQILPNNTIQLVPNAANTTAFAAQDAQAAMSSPTRRFQVVSGPVTYHCDPASGNLFRYADYPIQAAQPTSGGNGPLTPARQALLATGVENCTFTADTLSNRAAVVSLRLTLKNGLNDERLSLFQQIHVDNTP